MKDRKRKGFTLVEVLATLVILGILVLIVMGLINVYAKKGKNDYNEKLLEQAVVSGKAFYSGNVDRTPVVGEYDMVSLKELKTGNYLSKDFVDSKNNSCMEESFVTALNDGSNKYYACLKCGNETYMTDESKCDFEPEDFVPDDDDDFGDDSLACSVNFNKSTATATVNVTKGTATKKWYTGSDTQTFTGNSVSITKSGYYYFYVSDGSTTVYCGYASNAAQVVNTSGIEYKMYYATQTQYSKKQTSGLSSYDGTEWKSGYAYVVITNKSSLQNISPSLDSNGGFWITTQGEKTTTVTATSGGVQKSLNITTRLDRTPPTITVSSSSDGKWTNKAVTVKATAKDSYSDIDKIQHLETGKSAYANFNNTEKGTKSITAKIVWAKKDRKFTMYIIATDLAGNVSDKEEVLIKQDITPPEFVEKCYYGKGTVQGGAPAWVWKHKWKDNLSGIESTESRHCYEGSSAAGYDKCSVWPLNGTYKGSYRGWADRGSSTGSSTLTFYMKYKYSPTQTVAYVFNVCDRADNCTKKTSSDTYIPAKKYHCD